jgi:hypothetical protein
LGCKWQWYILWKKTIRITDQNKIFNTSTPGSSRLVRDGKGDLQRKHKNTWEVIENYRLTDAGWKLLESWSEQLDKAAGLIKEFQRRYKRLRDEKKGE